MRNSLLLVLLAVLAFLAVDLLSPAPLHFGYVLESPPTPAAAERLHVEAIYRLAGCSLWQGSLRRVEDGAPMLEGEALPAGVYYCEKPACIEIEGLGVRQLHQYALLHVESHPVGHGPGEGGGDGSPGAFRVLRASTAPNPRERQPYNWQPNGNRDWVCRVTCTQVNFMAVCEDGLCYCLKADVPPESLPPTIGGVIYANQRACGIRR